MPRGGKRAGAGRPPTREWLEGFAIGQACEVLWRSAEQDAGDERLRKLPHADEVHALQAAANAIPVEQRRAWVASDHHDDHVGDLECWLHRRAGTQFDEERGMFVAKAPRGVEVSKKPPRGTRQRIIAEVASRYGISEHTTNRLWKAYRRFERELRAAN